jgi:hypothetical protein
MIFDDFAKGYAATRGGYKAGSDEAQLSLKAGFRASPILSD